MKIILLPILACIFLSLEICAQSPIILDEFDNRPCDHYLATMDATLAKAAENPQSTVYVILYEGKESRYNFRKSKPEFVYPHRGSAEAKIRSMKRYISVVRKFPVDRFRFVKGGFREKLSVEIWLVPPGAELPKLSPTLPTMRYSKGKPKGFCLWCCD